jgi:hypothetical protein
MSRELMSYELDIREPIFCDIRPIYSEYVSAVSITDKQVEIGRAAEINNLVATVEAVIIR